MARNVAPGLVFTGGPVFTGATNTVTGTPGAGRQPRAVAVSGERILAVGPQREIMALVGPRTRVVDLKGRLLMPGFIDAHAHLIAHGATKLQVDCKYPAAGSIGDIQARIRERARATSEPWIWAHGYDQSRLLERRHPTRLELDAACADRPVVLMRTCGHIAVVNTRALEMAEITADTPDPPGGVFDRDESGRPSGVLRETAMTPVLSLAASRPEELVTCVEAGSRDYARLGVTSVHEAGATAQGIKAFQAARRRGLLRTRMYLMLGFDVPGYQEAFLTTGLSTGFGDQWLKIGPLKLMADGSSSGPTAATREPYAVDPDDCGILHLTQDEINERFLTAHRQGFQVAAHAVGDRAVEMVVEGIERAMRDCRATGDRAAAAGRPPPRHRVEHCAMTDSGLRERIRRLGIVPILQPVFFYEFGDGYVANYGPRRAAEMFAAGSFLRAGVKIALSTDCPVTSADPMLNVYTAITRQTMGGDVVGPGERITVEEALQAYTMGGAYAAHEESIKGSIEPGTLADLVVLSGNPLPASPSEIREMKTVMTVLGGEVVYEADSTG